MKDREILEMFYLVESCKLNLHARHKHKFDNKVESTCKKFCKKHKIQITHETAFKELRHKTYYYKNKCINSIINNGVDLYELRKNTLVNDTEIVNKLIKDKLRNKIIVTESGAIGFYM